MWKKILLSTGLLACLTCPQFVTDAYTVSTQQTDVNLKLTYPLIYLDNQTAQTKINTVIASYVEKMRSMYYNDKMYSVNMNYTVTYEDKNFLSITIGTSWYNGKAIHGMNNLQGLVFNKYTGDLIPAYNYVKIRDDRQLYSLVKDGILNVTTLSTNKRLYVSEIFAKDAIPVRNDNYIMLGKGRIAMIYQPYELGSYADGVTQIIFTPEKMEYINRLNS